MSTVERGASHRRGFTDSCQSTLATIMIMVAFSWAWTLHHEQNHLWEGKAEGTFPSIFTDSFNWGSAMHQVPCPWARTAGMNKPSPPGITCNVFVGNKAGMSRQSTCKLMAQFNKVISVMKKTATQQEHLASKTPLGSLLFDFAG